MQERQRDSRRRLQGCSGGHSNGSAVDVSAGVSFGFEGLEKFAMKPSSCFDPPATTRPVTESETHSFARVIPVDPRKMFPGFWRSRDS
jgi:hypothetical protein